MAVLVTNPGSIEVRNIGIISSQPVVSNTTGNIIGYELLYSEEVNEGMRNTPASSSLSSCYRYDCSRKQFIAPLYI